MSHATPRLKTALAALRPATPLVSGPLVGEVESGVTDTLLRPATPLVSGPLTILPFTTTHTGRAHYVLLPQAIDRGRLTVTEVSDGGSVSYLKAVNQGPWPVLIFDGEELVGAKQNRIVNTTILVGVGETILPVSCVEQGRWSHRSKAFAAGRYASHPTMRQEKEHQVRAALTQSEPHQGHMAAEPIRPQAERAERFRTDQGAIWAEVHTQSARAGVHSATSAMADAYETRAADLQGILAGLTGSGGKGTADQVPVDGMVAAAVFLFDRFLCLDALWPAKRFAQLYPKLLQGYALEALNAEGRAPKHVADPEAEILRLFADLAEVEPVERPAVDLGRDLRAETKTAVAAGLAWERQLVQLSVFPR